MTCPFFSWNSVVVVQHGVEIQMGEGVGSAIAKSTFNRQGYDGLTLQRIRCMISQDSKNKM